MKSVHSDTTERINKERVGRLISLFEVRRPKRSPNSTLKKSKSISSLAAALSSDEDEPKTNQKRMSSTNHTLSNDKNRRRTKSTRSVSSQEDQSNNHMKHIFDDIEESNNMVDDFGLKLKMKRQQKAITAEFTDYCKQKSLQRTSETLRTSSSHSNSHKEAESTPSYQSLERRYNKKDHKKTSNTGDTPCKELISRKRSKEVREKIENSTDTKSDSDVEVYREKIVKEIDLVLKNFKNNGLIDDEENVNILDITDEHVYESYEQAVEEFESQETPSKSTWTERLNSRRMGTLLPHSNEEYFHLVGLQPQDSSEVTSADTILAQNNAECLEYLSSTEPEVRDVEVENELISSSDSSSSNRTLVENSDVASNLLGKNEENRHFYVYENLSDDEFGESLAEDLEENGSYFVEAYNDEGKELIIVEIAVERRAVDLNSLDTITESIENSDMVFHQNEDKSLNLIDNPKQFVSAESISSGFVTSPDSSRSTVYSTASRDSEVFDTDDEGISLGHGHKYDEVPIYNNFRRETFCDYEGVVRIERVGYPEDHVGDEESRSPVSRDNSFTQKGTLSYIVDEIKSTERKYVEDLHRVVTKYKPYIEEHTPPNLIGRQCYIFGNIDKLYSKQKEFLMALEHCGDTVDGVVRTFIDFEKLFKLYPKYFKNKPKADVVVKEFSEVVKRSQIKFEERLDLSSYLLTPLQRLGKYKLFLENIEKQLKKLDQPIGSVEMALEIIKGEMSKGNDFVAIESIENSPINKEDYGSFKMREKFNVLKPRRFEAMVFLFENIIVFTICDPKNMDTYNYFTSIKMMDLRIATFEDLTIHLTDFTMSKRISRADRFTYVLEAKSQKVKETWRKAVEEILWQQLVKAKENTLKMYQSSMGSKKSKMHRKLVKSTGSAKFYID